MADSPWRLSRLLRLAAVGFCVVFLTLTVVGAATTAGAQPDAAAAGDVLNIEDTGATMLDRARSFIGIFVLIGLAALFSTDRKRIDWRLVAAGIGLQLAFALFILKTTIGAGLFAAAGDGFTRLILFTDEGSKVLFGSFMNNGELMPAMISFTFTILPTIIFFSSLMAVLYYLGIMQAIVNVFAIAMQKTLRTSGSETLSAAGNIFVGQTEAPLLVKPFVSGMTQSELMAVMTGGFATVAGGVMGAYIGFLAPYFPDIAGHLLAASVMSAPAALVIAKVMVPETEESQTKGSVRVEVERIDVNAIDAAARGASEGLTLAFNVAAMLLAFIALIAMVNFLLGTPAYIQHGAALAELIESIRAAGGSIPPELVATCDVNHVVNEATGETVRVAFDARAACIADISAAVANAPEVSTWTPPTLEWLLGWIFAPIAWAMGVPWQDCLAVGQLMGSKLAINEFVAYLQLSGIMSDPETALQPRSALIATYALCGFANFGSIGIQIGGISGIAPDRRSDLARLGMRAMIGGTLAAFLTATIAGMLVS